MRRNPLDINLRWIWLIVVVVLLDQGTKQLVVISLQPDRPMRILPSVEFVLSYNKGISFSFLQFADDAQPLQVGWAGDHGTGKSPVLGYLSPVNACGRA